MRRMWSSLLVSVVVLLAGLVFAGAVSAAVPWWHLNVAGRPSLLHAPATETQEVKGVADGEGHLVVKLEVEGTGVACVANSASVGVCGGLGLPAVRTSAQLRSALEGVYGSGRVGVTGGPSGGAPYIVSTLEREVPPLQAVAVYGTGSASETGEGGSGRLLLVAYNLGDAPTSGDVALSGVLPAGLTATRVLATSAGAELPESSLSADPLVKCSLVGVSCVFTGSLLPYQRLEMLVWVTRSENAQSGEHVTGTVSGGGAGEVSRTGTVSYRETVPFGVEAGSYELVGEEEGGAPDVSAGSHPFQLSTTFRTNETGSPPFQPAQPRELRFYLPPGFVGDAQATPQCTYAQFMTLVEEGAGLVDKCPADTAVGVSVQQLITGLPPNTSFTSGAVPLFNLVPAKGEPARFGFEILKVPVLLDTSARTGGDYGVTVSVHNLAQTAAVAISSIVTVWGVPGDPRHDNQRGWACLNNGQQPGCGPSLGSGLPLESMPTACEPFQAPMQASSWQPGAELVPAGGLYSTFGSTLNGCNDLPFNALIEAVPDKESASTPSGLTVHVRVPQEAALNPNGRTDADVRTITVALPAGMTLNPGGANGLEACSEAQIGFLGKEASEPAHDLFTATLPEPFCPNGSKVGTVRITTPLLPNSLEGSVYLADPAPNAEGGMNPFDGLVALYVVAEDPVSGTIVKLPGRVQPCEQAGQVLAGVTCEAPGQLVSTFEDSPQLPFEDAELHFFGGENAPLATPALCGTYTTHATFAPWSGTAPVHSESTFKIVTGPGNTGLAGCSTPRPFAPEFVTESTNIQAGAFSELRTTMGHPDADQTLGGLSVKMPPGLSGLLSSVKLCGEPQAAQGTCGPESLIGHTVVTAGLGNSPAVVKRPGDVYITGPYKGAPYGLSIVNPAEAGPFDLGTVVVRAKIEVDPITAQLTVTSDPLPTMLKGIPLDLQHVQVAIDRPGFTFNPTNCSRLKVQATMFSSEGATAPVSTPFQVTNCATLAFKPSFKVSTSAHTSRQNGAGLHVKLTYPKAPFGSQTNIAKVKVNLPHQLPSRLGTLQHACPHETFEANPAACPSESRVGYARATTPLLPVALEGPAYFVSYGGQQFPELIVVLQGYGVTVDLHGETFINEKTGVTSSTFRTVPDVPVGTFELSLPQGRFSALGANANLCRAKGGLKMPTSFVAQNGATIKQVTKIAVGGCPKAHHKKKRKKRKK